MLNTFNDWAELIVAKFRDLGLNAEFRTGPHSACLDLDTHAFMARIDFWDSGAYFAEVLNGETGQTVFQKHGEIQVGQSYHVEFKSFFETLGINNQ